MQVSPRFRCRLAVAINDPGRERHIKCNRSLPFCSRCTEFKVACTYTIDNTKAAPPTLNNPRGTLIDFRDSGMGLNTYERSASISTIINAGRTSIDYLLDRSDPMDSPYGQSRTPTTGGHMGNGDSQTSPFATASTPIPSNTPHGLPMEPADNDADVRGAFGFRDPPAATFEGDLSGITAEGRTSLAIDPRLQDIGWEYGQQEHIVHPGFGSQ